MTLDEYRSYQAHQKERFEKRKDRHEAKIEAVENTIAEDDSEGEVEKVAEACLRPDETMAVSESSVSAADYIREHYDVEPADHRTDNSLLRAMSASVSSEEEG